MLIMKKRFKIVWWLEKYFFYLQSLNVSLTKTHSMNYKFLILIFALISFANPTLASNKSNKSATSSLFLPIEKRANVVYSMLDSNNFSLPNLVSFTEALNGFYDLKEKGLITKDILTIIDFSLSSTKKRLWIIDLSTNTVLLNSLVSHGMNSGGEYANSFSNSNSSNKSSLGFYATGEVYRGKHGTSLKLDGLEKGLNSNARARAVVIHGADYANPTILKSQGFLGRSQGCPAIPQGLSLKVINLIKNKSCLFIYHPARSNKYQA
jgi:L,D-transpeptidase catalytic domain